MIKAQSTWDDSYAYVESLVPLTHHDYYYICGKIEQGWITNRDIDIVHFLSVHRWLTLSQITRLFFPETESTSTTIRNRVNKLQKYGLIRKIKWTSHTNPKENRPSIYEIGASGADILKYRMGVFLGNRDPRRPKEVSMTFRQKYIATNEFYILLKKSFELNFFEFHPVLNLKETQVAPTAQFILSNPSGKQLQFYLFCYRDEENWLKTIRFQAKFMKEFLISEGKEAMLIILVSTEAKAILASKIIDQEGVSTQTWFITDVELKENEDGITKSFFVYQDGRKNYLDLG